MILFFLCQFSFFPFQVSDIKHFRLHDGLAAMMITPKSRCPEGETHCYQIEKAHGDDGLGRDAKDEVVERHPIAATRHGPDAAVGDFTRGDAFDRFLLVIQRNESSKDGFAAFS